MGDVDPAPSASRALAGADEGRGWLRTGPGRSGRGCPAAGSRPGTAGCRYAGSGPGPGCPGRPPRNARRSYPAPAGLPERGGRVPAVRPALLCGSARLWARSVPLSRSPAAPRGPGASRPRRGGCPQVGAGGARRAGPLTSRWCCGRPVPGAAGPRRTAPGPAQLSRCQPSRAGPGSGTGPCLSPGLGEEGTGEGGGGGPR